MVKLNTNENKKGNKKNQQIKRNRGDAIERVIYYTWRGTAARTSTSSRPTTNTKTSLKSFKKRGEGGEEGRKKNEKERRVKLREGKLVSV